MLFNHEVETHGKHVHGKCMDQLNKHVRFYTHVRLRRRPQRHNDLLSDVIWGNEQWFVSPATRVETARGSGPRIKEELYSPQEPWIGVSGTSRWGSVTETLKTRASYKEVSIQEIGFRRVMQNHEKYSF